MTRKLVLSGCLAVAMVCSLAVISSAKADDRKGAEILKEIKVIAIPTVDASKKANKSYMKEFNERHSKVMAKRAELIGELHKVDPLNSELKTLLPTRWKVLLEEGASQAPTVKTETTDALIKTKDRGLKTEATYYKASSELLIDEVDSATKVKDVEAFVKMAPKDFRGAQLLLAAADSIDDPDKKTALLKQVVTDYARSKVANEAREALKNVGKANKPFDLEFTDAISGAKISMASLKGKVVVVDFWATWCGPCVAEMPKMKKLYAEYKDQGVEFIGVSLDQPKEKGGLDALKAFVAKNEISWPQYYQGNFWQSKFSSSLGINSIPCVYILDAKGKLISTEARGKLEVLIPQLLKKAGRPKAELGG